MPPANNLWPARRCRGRNAPAPLRGVSTAAPARVVGLRSGRNGALRSIGATVRPWAARRSSPNG
jgi:hypothetical protein